MAKRGMSLFGQVAIAMVFGAAGGAVFALPDTGASFFQVAVAQAASGGCNIKSNISTRGERIYHVPGQEYYNETRIRAPLGERWFCSEEEARAAGWRRSKV